MVHVLESKNDPDFELKKTFHKEFNDLVRDEKYAKISLDDKLEIIKGYFTGRSIATEIDKMMGGG